MFRLSVLLCAAMFVTLLIAGEDRGQMRPGLAAALASGEEIRLIERRLSAPVAVKAPEPSQEAEVVVVAAAAPAASAAPQAETAPVVEAAYVPEPAPAPARRVIPEPVFTLSSLPSLGGDEARIADEAAQPASDEGADGSVWYVEANSVNVRQGPSTDDSIVGKLSAGEAVTVIAQVDAEWFQIMIEGDGVEGFVAARFLSRAAP